MGNKVKDLTMRGTYKSKNKAKSLVLSNGNTVEVPLKDWENEIIHNPRGATADKARKDKDPDLKNVSVPVIRREMFTGPHRVSPEELLDESEKIDRRRSLGVGSRDLRVSNVSKEAAKRRGLISAEEGKTIGGKGVGRDSQKDA